MTKIIFLNFYVSFDFSWLHLLQIRIYYKCNSFILYLAHCIGFTGNLPKKNSFPNNKSFMSLLSRSHSYWLLIALQNQGQVLIPIKPIHSKPWIESNCVAELLPWVFCWLKCHLCQYVSWNNWLYCTPGRKGVRDLHRK